MPKKNKVYVVSTDVAEGGSRPPSRLVTAFGDQITSKPQAFVHPTDTVLYP